MTRIRIRIGKITGEGQALDRAALARALQARAENGAFQGVHAATRAVVRDNQSKGDTAPQIAAAIVRAVKP